MEEDILAGIEDQERVKDTCAHCGKAVVPDNDSGWEVFVEGGTQPLCSDCNDSPEYCRSVEEGLKEMVERRNREEGP